MQTAYSLRKIDLEWAIVAKNKKIDSDSWGSTKFSSYLLVEFNNVQHIYIF